jgi:hypothetical protein
LSERTPNKTEALNPARTPPFQAENQWRRVGDLDPYLAVLNAETFLSGGVPDAMHQCHRVAFESPRLAILIRYFP